MKTIKTILEWLNEAKEQGYEWADAAIRNYNPDFTTVKERKSLRDALAGAFAWDKSPEEHNYWEGVSASLRAADAGYRVLSPTTAMNSTSIECLIEDLGKLNKALENLEYNETLKEPYRTQVYEATKASYKEQLAEVKVKIAERLGIEPVKERKLIGWVVQNEDGGYSKYTVPNFIKEDDGWFAIGEEKWSDITPEEAVALCDRLPQWNDAEPTPIY